MEQLKFAEQKTETKLKTFIQSISISSGHDISTYDHIEMFHKELYKTVGAFALKGTTYYIDIDKILIALKAKNAGKVINVKLRFYMIKII